MSRALNGLLMGLLSSAVVFSAAACRRAEPPDAYAQNLGTEDAPLLPTASVFKQPGIVDGRADWVDFREPGDDGESDGAVGSAGIADSANVEAEIRTMIEDYNGLLSDSEATVDDFLDFYVESQHDLVRALLESTPAFAQTIQELRDELQTKKADASDRIDSAIKTLESTIQRELVANSISVLDDSKVTVTLTTGPLAPAFECIIVEDEWFIQIPNTQAFEAAKSALNTYRGWLDDLKAGRTSPDDILQKVETAARVPQASGSQDGEGDESDN